nr:site-specific DNA-methyltransferase [Clostridia bacterium]
MAIKYIPFFPEPIEGQALLDNFKRTLRYKGAGEVQDKLRRGMPLYEMEKVESVLGGSDENLVIHGECVSACAYFKDKGIKVDLVYIDPPFASGADYAKKIYIRKNPKVAELIDKAEQELDNDDLKEFEDKMYGDVWDKEKYLNWMYENLMAIKSVMSETASIYVHLDWHIGHYVKILMDEIFGEDNFRNELIWKYFGPTSGKNNYPRKHDVIYFYVKNIEKYYFDFNACLVDYDEKAIKRYDKIDEDGRRYKLYNEKDGTVRKAYMNEGTPTEVFEIPGIQNPDYATQKPDELVSRLIRASSNENMIVADFFSGSGVTSAVASKLNRKFIAGDVNLNSIQTTRDRLVSIGAKFDLLEIKDGVSLYRNPVQTMDKIKSLITGLKNEDSLDEFWEGAISDSKLGLIPVYVPNLMDSTTKLLDEVLMNRILHEAIPELDSSVKKVIVYYVDITDKAEIEKFIKDDDSTMVEIELRDLKEILDDVVVDDHIEFTVEENKDDLLGGYIISVDKFISDRVSGKILEFNQKSLANSSEKKPYKPITISEDGLEMIEFISLDCTADSGEWHSDSEIKVEGKTSYVTINGKKTKEFWDGTIKCEKKPLRLKVRNICGDESVVIVE